MHTTNLLVEHHLPDLHTLASNQYALADVDTALGLPASVKFVVCPVEYVFILSVEDNLAFHLVWAVFVCGYDDRILTFA